MNLFRRLKHKIRSHFIVVGPQGPSGIPGPQGRPGKDHSKEIAELHERLIKLEGKQ